MVRYSAATAARRFPDASALNVHRRLIMYAVIVPNTQATAFDTVRSTPNTQFMMINVPKSTTAAMTPEMMKRVICTISP